MGARTFFDPQVKAKVAAAIGEAEQKTAAEVVVALRKDAGHYRHTDYLIGAALAMASLLMFLFYPEPFDPDFFPLEMAAAFVIGAVASAHLAPLRRLCTGERLMEKSARTAAHAAFVELGVSRTKGRTGVLVFVSMFERRAVVVADVGVDEAALGEPWKDVLFRLDGAVREAEIDRFLDALRAMGKVLGEALPHASDDVDELANEVRA